MMKRRVLSFTLSFLMGISCFHQGILSLSAEEEEGVTETTQEEEELPAEDFTAEEEAAGEDTDTEVVEIVQEEEAAQAPEGDAEVEYEGFYDIYPDRVFETTVKFVLPSSSYTAVLKVGGYNGELQEDKFDYLFTDGVDYSFENGILKLFTEEMIKKWQGPVAIYAAVMDGNNLDCSDTCFLCLREPVEDYHHRENEILLPTWGGAIDDWEIVFVQNSDYPYGSEIEYDVTGARVINEVPAVQGRKVVELNENTSDPYHNGWNYHAVSAGEADIEITYKKLNGEKDTYLMHITVAPDKYDLNVQTEEGNRNFLPGTGTTLHADVYHHSTDPEREGDLNGVTYEWKLDDNSAQYVTLTQDSENPDTARVVFKENGSLSEWVVCPVDVIVYDESGAQVAKNTIYLNVAPEFAELYPTMTGQILPGQNTKITAELRHFAYGQEGYTVEDNVHFKWGYDPNAVEVYDAAGNYVGWGEDGYADSEGSYGGSCEFTVVRKNSWGTNLRLEAEVEYPDGYVEHFDQNYWLNELNYDVWFNIDDNRIFSDGIREVYLENHIGEGAEYDLTVEAGISREGQWEMQLQEGTDFTFDGEKVTLYGDKIFAKGLDHVDLKATVTIGDQVVHETYNWLEVREAKADYEFENDRNMLPGWEESVDNKFQVYVENAEYPGGEDFFCEVTNVEIAEEERREEGRPVLRLQKEIDEDNPSHSWWDYRAVGHGRAVLKVTYIDLEGQEQSYTFNVYVSEDVYDVYPHSEDKSDRTLPGKTVKMLAELRHDSEDGDTSIDNAVYEWNIREGEQWASIHPNPDDASKADLIIREAQPDERDFWDRVIVEVIVYDGNDDQGNPIERCRNEFHVHVADHYDEVWPVEIKKDLNLHGEETITAEVRQYSSEEDGYTLADDVTFRWYYDDEIIDILDSDGNVVGNDSDDGEYQGSDASTGRQCDFTIVRKDTRGTGFHLEAEWTDKWGNDRYEGRGYGLDNMNSRLWFEFEGDNLFTDGDKEILIRTEGISGERGTDYEQIYKIGVYDEGQQKEVLFAEGKEYDVEGDKIILHGKEIGKLGYDHFTIISEIYVNGSLTAFDMMECRVEEPIYDYNFLQDRSMLPGWFEPIDKQGNIYIENSEHPEGYDQSYTVTSVRILKQNPQESGKKVLELLNSDDPGVIKMYKALNYGDAVIEVTYKDFDGKSKKYTFNVYVTHDVYGVNINTSDGSTRALPGETIHLYADGHHASDQDPSMDNVTYSWYIEWGYDCARLTVDPEDSSHAMITFRELEEDERNIWKDIIVSVRMYTTDESGEQNEKAFNDIRLVMSDHYNEVWPARIEELLPGSSRMVTAVVREYSADDDEQYSQTENVHYRWYYDPGTFRITDSAGNQIGNNDENGNYNDSPESYGAAVGFTISKIQNNNSQITLMADWIDEWGHYREERRDYFFDDVWYELQFHPEDCDVYDDYEAGAVLDTGALEDLDEDYEIVYEAGVYDGSRWTVRFTEGTDFEIDGEELLVNGRTISKKLPAGTEFFQIRAVVLYKGFEIGDGWISLHMKKACGNHVWDEEVIAEPTQTEQGWMVQTCRNCGETRLIPIPPVQKIDPTSISFTDSSVEMPTAHVIKPELNVLPAGADSSVTYESSNEKVAAVDQDGKIQAKTYGKAVITATSTVNPKLKAEITVQTRFYDVNDSTQSYYKPVYWGADNGVVAGFNGGEYFGPDESCTRAQFVTFLWRLAGKPTGTKDVSFPDVDPKANYFRAVKWAVSEGIIVGFKHEGAPATFEPDGLVTRGQTATMLWRYGGRKPPKTGANFKDVKSTDSIYRAVSWGQEVGIIKGYKSGEFAGQFRPDDSCLRQHIVTFLYRYARDVMHKNVN